MAVENLIVRQWTAGKIYVDPATISANMGLEYPRLIIPVKLTLNPVRQRNTVVLTFSIINTRAELFLADNPSLKISDSVSGSFPHNVILEGGEAVYSLEFPLNYKQVSKIETYRRDNLKLLLKLCFTNRVYEQESAIPFETRIVDMRFDIEQSYWVKNILPSLDFGEYFIVEIPKGEKRIKKAWEYIETAEKSYKMWDTKGAFANCRETGSLLDKIVREILSNKPDLKKWKRAIDKFNSLCSLDLHTEDIKNERPQGEITINKNDTEHIIIVTKALLKYAEELLLDND